jgi:hypothetical protein
MTDRYNALTVILDHDIRDDDAKGLIDAILQLRGVLSVKGRVKDIADDIALDRTKLELRTKLWEVLK